MGGYVAPGMPVDQAPGGVSQAAAGEARRAPGWVPGAFRGWWAHKPLTPEEVVGFRFWGVVALAIGAVELAGALSGAFKDFFPWPTISATVGRLQDAASWVGVVVVAAIAMVAYAVVGTDVFRKAQAEGEQVPRTPHGRVLRPGEEEPEQFRGPPRLRWFRYSWPTVLVMTGLTAWLVHSFDDRKFILGYAIYGSFLFFGVLIPSALVRWRKKELGFPPLLLPLTALWTRLPWTRMVIVAGLAILVVHLALYPWPDLTRESASYAGLKAGQARTRAVRTIRTARAGLPELEYSAHTRGIANGRAAWLVYFSPVSGSGALPYSGCVVIVTKASVEPSGECLK